MSQTKKPLQNFAQCTVHMGSDRKQCLRCKLEAGLAGQMGSQYAVAGHSSNKQLAGSWIVHLLPDPKAVTDFAPKRSRIVPDYSLQNAQFEHICVDERQRLLQS